MSATVTLPPPEAGALELIVRTSDNVQVVALESGKVVRVGRGEGNGVRIECPSVSRAHLELRATRDGLELEDLGSSNGTTLLRAGAEGTSNQEQLRPNEHCTMRVGDTLRVGSALLSLKTRRRSVAPVRAHSTRLFGGPGVLLDPAVKRAYELVTRAAATEICVLILGETGAGKEAMAETVHQRSPRSGGPFLQINCAALSETLLESELFGHERGAFTGAHASKAGLLEATAGGTIFLDEIGELSLGTQAKLLRVLEERTVMRVGATRPRRIDVRFVCATNRDLVREVQLGRFRGDLYYRISGLVVRIPPLRERPSEIEPLAAHFLREFCSQLGQTTPELGSTALEALHAYHWPGNVRELKNVVERAVLLAGGGPITQDHVLLEATWLRNAAGGGVSLGDDAEESTQLIGRPPGQLRREGPRSSRASPDSRGSSRAGAADSRRSRGPAPPSSRRREARSEDENRERLIRALEACGGNQTRAAELLGISRRTLINRLDRWKLPRPQKR